MKDGLIGSSVAIQESQIEEQNRRDKNAIGGRGENIAYVRLTEEHRLNLYFLGEKAKTIDFLVEIRNPLTPYFAFLQVKTTDTPEYTRDGNLKVGITTDDLMLLLEKPLPTYFVGVDEDKETVYVAPIYKKHIHGYTSSIPNDYKLEFGHRDENINVIRKLEEDITNFSHQIGNIKDQYQTVM